MNFKLLLALLCCFSLGLQAQDPHFSLFNLASLDVNPANTGRLDTRARLTTIYRSQWNTVLGSKAYQSAYAAFESQISCLDNRFFAIGIVGKYDRVGSIKLTRSYGYGSFAYHHGLSRNQFLSAGFQLGLIDFRLQSGGLQFDEQFDGIGFNGSLPSFEEGAAFGNTVMDFNLGVSYYDTQRNFTLGLALVHILQPEYSFLEGSNKLEMGLAVHGELFFNDNATFGVRGLFRKQSLISNKQWYALIAPTFVLLDHTRGISSRLQLSVGARFGGRTEPGFAATDAVLINLLFKTGKTVFSANYDLNISPLSQASYTVGGFELGVSVPLSTQDNCVYCPSF